MKGKLKVLTLLWLFLVLLNPINNTSVEMASAAPPAYITLGGLFPLTGQLSAGGVEQEAAFRMAIEKINSDPNLLPDTVLKSEIRDTATDPSTGETVAKELIDLGVFGLVGAASSNVSEAVSWVAEASRVPQISYTSNDIQLSNKNNYPYFLRIIPAVSEQGTIFANIVNYFGWESIATITGSGADQTAKYNALRTLSENLNINIVISENFEEDEARFEAPLQNIKESKVRIIVINASDRNTEQILNEAKISGMTAEAGYVWIFSMDQSMEKVYAGNNNILNLGVDMLGSIGITPKIVSTEKFIEFLDLWESKNPAIYPGAGDRTPDPYTVFVYDAVYAFAKAAHNLILNGVDPVTGDQLLVELTRLRFSGVTGDIYFNENYDRELPYYILNMQPTGLIVVGTWSKASAVSITDEIIWPDGTTNIPSGWKRSFIEEVKFRISIDAKLFWIILILTISTLLIAIFIIKKKPKWISNTLNKFRRFVNIKNEERIENKLHSQNERSALQAERKQGLISKFRKIASKTKSIQRGELARLLGISDKEILDWLYDANTGVDYKINGKNIEFIEGGQKTDKKPVSDAVVTNDRSKTIDKRKCIMCLGIIDNLGRCPTCLVSCEVCKKAIRTGDEWTTCNGAGDEACRKEFHYSHLMAYIDSNGKCPVCRLPLKRIMYDIPRDISQKLMVGIAKSLGEEDTITLDKQVLIENDVNTVLRKLAVILDEIQLTRKDVSVGINSTLGKLDEMELTAEKRFRHILDELSPIASEIVLIKQFTEGVENNSFSIPQYNNILSRIINKFDIIEDNLELLFELHQKERSTLDQIRKSVINASGDIAMEEAFEKTGLKEKILSYVKIPSRDTLSQIFGSLKKNIRDASVNPYNWVKLASVFLLI